MQEGMQTINRADFLLLLDQGITTFAYLEFTEEIMLLKSMDLSNLCFNHCRFIKTNFENCTMHNTIFLNTVFERTELCDIVLGSFTGCVFDNVTFYKISQCQFTGCNFRTCSIREQVITNTAFVRTIFSNTYFTSSKMDCVRFTSCDFTTAYFNNSFLVNVCFNKTSLTLGDFSYCYLLSPKILDCELYSCSFKRVGCDINLRNIIHGGNNLVDKDYLTKRVIDQPMIVYKKVMVGSDETVATLEIPKGAIIYSVDGEKYRTNIAKCIAIDGGFLRAKSVHIHDFNYRVGKTYKVYDFEFDTTAECAKGIHFFLTKKEAEDY